jgi:TolB protein
LKGAGETGVGEASPSPFWSPDSESLGYSAAGRLWRISATDGEPVAICNMPGAIVGGAWQTDGVIAFSTTRGPMYQVTAAGGEPKVLIRLADGEVDFHQPAVLPDGGGLLYAVHGRTGTNTIEVYRAGARKVVLRAAEQARITPQVFNLPAYSPTGHIAYRLDEGNVGVWAVPFSLSKLETTGEPFLVASGARNPSMADDGTLVYAPTSDAAPGQLVWLRRDGTVEQEVGEAKQGIDDPAISPDGNRIAYTAIENNNSDVWVVSAAGSTRITATPGNETRPQWMTDGRTIAFSCPTEQGGAVCARAADGSGDMRVLIKDASEPRFAPDGRVAVYQTSGTAERGLKIFDLQTGQSRPYVMSTFELLPMGFSANGRYLRIRPFRAAIRESTCASFLPAMGSGKFRE